MIPSAAPSTSNYARDTIEPNLNTMKDCLARHYRYPDGYIRFATKGPLPATSGYFQFGEGVICYGNCSGRRVAH